MEDLARCPGIGERKVYHGFLYYVILRLITLNILQLILDKTVVG
jgi:hypothetical protein